MTFEGHNILLWKFLNDTERSAALQQLNFLFKYECVSNGGRKYSQVSWVSRHLQTMFQLQCY